MDFKKELNAVHSLMERTCSNYKRVIKEDVDSDLTKLIDLMSEHFADISTEFGAKMNEFKYDLFSRYDIENPSEVKAALKYILDVAEQRDMVTVIDGRINTTRSNNPSIAQLIGKLYQEQFGENIVDNMTIGEDDIVEMMDIAFNSLEPFKGDFEAIKRNIIQNADRNTITPEKGDQILNYLEKELNNLKRRMFEEVFKQFKELGVDDVSMTQINDAFKSFIQDKIREIFIELKGGDDDSPNPEPLD